MSAAAMTCLVEKEKNMFFVKIRSQKSSQMN